MATRMPSSTVHLIHFEDHDPRDFERLVFAYLLRADRWQTLEWYGQVGADLGRDIWGVRDRDGGKRPTLCVQCANHRRVPFAKASRDIDKVAAGPNGVPDEFLLVTGGTVSSDLRDKVKTHAAGKRIGKTEVWSGPEFEERLRAKAESLLKRFVEGAPFPDAPSEISALVQSLSATSDEEILGLMAGLFDRPAFYTPFHSESSVPAFKKAITDTIEALNTGIHRLRDGTEIRRIPSRQQIKAPATRKGLAEIERMLSALRARYDEFVRSGQIRPCGCGDPDCPVMFTSSWQAGREMDDMRQRILDAFRRIYPAFDVRPGFGHNHHY
jgi:hypothetical protein